MKKIVQMLPVFAYGDAIGNDVRSMDAALAQAGYKTEIYAEHIDSRVRAANVYHIDRYRDSSDILIIYHLSTGSVLNERILGFSARVIIQYHNITPPEFFRGYNSAAEKACRDALKEAGRMKDKPIMCLADSEYNKQDLIRMGYTCPIEVLPIVIAFEDFTQKPDRIVTQRNRKSNLTNIIFTGRVAPNKKQQDLIRSFYYYHHYMNPDSMLYIVGGYDVNSPYYRRLVNYTKILGLTDSVCFTGHISFQQILAYYQTADLFLCLSEHEGFCVPLVEAMYFDIPIIAYDSTAVGETLGGAGLLLDDKTAQIVAEAMQYILANREVADQLVRLQRKRLQYFENDRIKKQLTEIVGQYYGSP